MSCPPNRLLDPRIPLADGLVVCANGVVCLGVTSRVLGCLAATMGRFETAEAHFEHALALNRRIGARSFLVRTRRAYAAILLDRAAAGDTERAAAQVEARLALAGELGMALELARLRDLARRSTPPEHLKAPARLRAEGCQRVRNGLPAWSGTVTARR